MICYETIWENKRGAKILRDLWTLTGETGLVGEGWKKKAKEERERRHEREDGVKNLEKEKKAVEENQVLVSDHGYSPKRFCVADPSSGGAAVSWIRNPLLYEPLFITLVDIIYRQRLGALDGIELAFFFREPPLEHYHLLGKEDFSQGKSPVEYRFALELFFLLFLLEPGIFHDVENGEDKPGDNTLERASAGISNNQYQGIYRSGKKAGSLLVTRQTWPKDDGTSEGYEKDSPPTAGLREFSFYPFRTRGFISFNRGTLEFRGREDTIPELTLHPRGGESYSIPLPEGRGELYFFMDIQEVLLGIKKKPLLSESLIAPLVLRAGEELKYTSCGEYR